MAKERILSMRKENGEELKVRYYISRKAPEESEFGCEMYAVGIEEGGERYEIDDFSPDAAQAELLLENLYENHLPPRALFSAAEVFITQ